jgi:hypothetical protein
MIGFLLSPGLLTSANQHAVILPVLKKKSSCPSLLPFTKKLLEILV